MGLQGLTFLQKARVSAANFLYKWTCEMILELDARGVGWSVENPASSLMWVTTPFVELLKQLNSFDAFSFHTCMFAAKRKKDTAIWTSVPQLRIFLERTCNGQHEHLPWGKTATGFATAEECAYNDHLCAAWAEAIYQFALANNFVPAAELATQVTSQSAAAPALNKAILGCLPRGRKVPPFISEFLEPQIWDITHAPEVQQLALGKRIPDSCSLVPKGSRLYNFVNSDGGSSNVYDEASGMPHFALIGIPREPEDFLHQACKLTHPTEMAMNVSPILLDNMKAYNDPAGLEFRRKQCEFANRLVRLCSELKTAEADCKAAMPQHLQRILRSKRLLLFEKLLEDMGYPDSSIAADMRNGFPLCGWMKESNVFPSRLRPPELSEEHLRSMSRSISARTIAATVSSGESDADSRLWQATLEEVEAGFLTGPWGAEHLGKESVVSPRFGLLQKGKLRPIDNFSSSQVNGTVGLREKFSVDTVDEICAMIKAWLQCSGEGLQLLGKTYDMKKAYRQIGICSSHLDFAWIAVWNPEARSPALFRMDTMPFGSTASVSGFLRISQAIKTLGIYHGGLIWTSFYDDFVCICKRGTEDQTDRMVRLLFDSLGWVLSSDVEKDRPFAEVFHALGVEIDLSGAPRGYFTVGNTAARKSEIHDRVQDILAKDELEPSVAESLRSRLLFADGQIFGRFAKQALGRIGAVSLRRSVEKPLSDDLRFALKWLDERLLTSPPRKIDRGGRSTFFLFLDGACAAGDTAKDSWAGTSVGGVLADSTGRVINFFGHRIDPALVATWGPPEKTQYIFEAEVLPFAIALQIWRSALRNCCLYVFIDNEAAKSSWITAAAHSKVAQNILHRGTLLEAELNVWPFFARVPTSSNFGDDPSRGRFHRLLQLGALRTFVNDDLIAELCAPVMLRNSPG